MEGDGRRISVSQNRLEGRNREEWTKTEARPREKEDKNDDEIRLIYKDREAGEMRAK